MENCKMIRITAVRRFRKDCKFFTMPTNRLNKRADRDKLYFNRLLQDDEDYVITIQTM